MVSAPDDIFFIIRLRHQSIFGVGKNWTSNLPFNHERLYQLKLIGTHFHIYMLIEEEEIGEFVPRYIDAYGKLHVNVQ